MFPILPLHPQIHLGLQKDLHFMRMIVVPDGLQPCLGIAKKCARTQPTHSFITALAFPDVSLMSEARKYIAYGPACVSEEGF